MPRPANPAPQYHNNGNPVDGGKMYYFDTGTSTPLTTYSDSAETAANTHPVILSADGVLPPVFFTGTAKQRLNDKNDVQLWERDPVGSSASAGVTSGWNTTIIYDINDVVKGSDNKYYISISASNVGSDPTTPSPTKWSEVVYLGIYNASQTYSSGVVISDSSGNIWKSVISNTGNTPSSDDGTNWIPAVDGSKISEVSNSTIAIPQTGASTLTAGRINELQDAGAFTLPLASSTVANQTITLDFPDKFTAFEPVVNRGGTDTISNNAGTDVSLTFKGSTRVILVSDGISDWRI